MKKLNLKQAGFKEANLENPNGFNFSRRQTPKGFKTLKSQTPKGFTLLELLLAGVLFVIVLAVGTNVLISTARSANKAEVASKAKQNGSRALQTFETEIRNSQSVLAPLPGVSDSKLDFLSANGAYVRYRLQPTAPAAGINQSLYREEFTDNTFNTVIVANSRKLTDDSVDGINVPNLSFQVDVTGKNVKISFDVNRSQDAAIPNLVQFNVQNVNFKSSVTMRN